MRSIAEEWLVSPIFFPLVGVGLFSPSLGWVFLSHIPCFQFPRRLVACPPLSLPSTSQTQLGRAFLGTKMFVSIFFLDSLDFLED